MFDISGTYPVIEHTGMAERETTFVFECKDGALTGTATIDAAPGVIETLSFVEAKADGAKFEVLIEYGNLGRRYTGEIADGKAKGTMVFEGGMEGVVIEFDTEKREVAAGGPPMGGPEGGPGGPPPMGGPGGGPGGPPPMGGPGAPPPQAH